MKPFPIPVLSLLAITFAAIFGPPALRAQEGSPAKIMLVLDASGSMWGEIDGAPKIEIARETVAEILGSWNPDREIGLMAYGHREKGNCEDIETLIPVGKLDSAAFLEKVNSIIPKGMTPLTDAVALAAENLRYTEETASVILVSDGKETCGKDPRAVAKELAKNGIGFRAHVIGFDITEEEGQSLAAIAEETGGTYLAASDAAGLKSALEKVVAVVEEEPAPAEKPAMEQAPAGGKGKVLLTAVAAEGSEEVSAYYTTYEAKKNLEGDQKKVASGSGRSLELEAGEYTVNAKWGNVARQMNFTVEPGKENEVVVVMDGGVLNLASYAAEGGDEVGAYYNIYSAKQDLSGNREQVASGTGKSPIVPAGDYLITAKWGNASASTEATVEPGASTSAEVVLDAGILVLSSSQTEGGEDIGAYYSIFKAEKNLSGERERVTSGTGKEPILPAGDYYITAKWGNASGQTEAKVEAGARTEAHVLIPSGVLKVTATDTAGNPVKAYHSVYFSKKNLEGERERITSGTGTNLQLPVGTYDIESKFGETTGSVTGVEVKAGEASETTIKLGPAE